MKSICGINNGGSLRSVTQYYKDLSQVAYVRDCYSDQHTCVNIENDEVIACALQEKLSRLSLQESIGSKSKASWKNCSFALDDNEDNTNTVTSSFNWEHRRLMERLKVYDVIERKVSGDGNCQFRALSDQIYGSSELHELVREQVVKQLESHKELYEGYVPMDYDEYVKKMIKCGEWSDHVTLQAAADLYGVKIFVITSLKDTCYIEILPGSYNSNKTILLSFQAKCTTIQSIHKQIILLEKQERVQNGGGLLH
ncbi:hypothetical protein CQW23_24381 [Capsicum baccatum]|uniref:ubiquitinyl hydrolase 1 n=1 Tax=Capsicum baccatum TaxID=33114 RepID=A0A2G2VUN6_CAPBA|nr:hypothetical protein CQW23_24381 [Capsicum baccatum]